MNFYGFALRSSNKSVRLWKKLPTSERSCLSNIQTQILKITIKDTTHQINFYSGFMKTTLSKMWLDRNTKIFWRSWGNSLLLLQSITKLSQMIYWSRFECSLRASIKRLNRRSIKLLSSWLNIWKMTKLNTLISRF